MYHCSYQTPLRTDTWTAVARAGTTSRHARCWMARGRWRRRRGGSGRNQGRRRGRGRNRTAGRGYAGGGGGGRGQWTGRAAGFCVIVGRQDV